MSGSSALKLRRIRAVIPQSVRDSLSHRYAWVTPAIGLLLALTIFPLIFLIYLSFQDWSLLIAARRNFVGLENYINVLTGEAFWNSLFITVVFTVIAVPTELVFGTAVAIFIYNRFPESWQTVFRTVFILPMMMSYIAVGLVWRYLWNGSIGFINYLLTEVGLPTQAWLGDPQMVLTTIIVADIWQWTPFVILVVLAGLQGLPEAPYEAAMLDGANSWHQLRYITLPLLRPILLVILLFRTADAYRIFDKVFIMTAGGPGDASMVLSMLIYRQSFKRGNFGTGAVISILMLIVISAVALAIIKRARSSGAI